LGSSTSTPSLRHASRIASAPRSRTQAASVAVITDLIAGGDPEARVRAYIARLARTGKV